MISKPDDTTQPAGLPGAPSPLNEEAPKRPRRKRPDLKVPALNIVPFMDMSFTLLLFLCLAASFSQGEGVLTANVPVGSGGGKAKEGDDATVKNIFEGNAIEIQVASSGERGISYAIRVNNNESPTDFDKLTKLLRELQASGAWSTKSPVVIKPTRSVRWQHVVNAFNAALRARFENIAFAQASGD